MTTTNKNFRTAALLSILVEFIVNIQRISLRVLELLLLILSMFSPLFQDTSEEVAQTF